MLTKASILVLALLPALFSGAILAVGQALPSDGGYKQQCIASSRYQLFTGDWPIAREIADQANYLKGAFWNTLEAVSKTASVCGCIADAEQFGNLNTSDLVTYTGKFRFKGQQLSITTRVSVQTVVTDFNDGFGLAQSTVVCYADEDDAVNNPYRCNILAKPAQLAAVTPSDQASLSFTAGQVAYAGESLTNPVWNPVPGLSAGLSRRDLATDPNIHWFSDDYSVGQYNLTLPKGFVDVSTPSNFTIRRAGAEYVNNTCERQAILQQSIASEVAGGATFACVMWGPIQVYSFGAFAFEVSNTPCSAQVTVPYAVFTLSAFNAIAPQGYMTIYTGVNDSNPDPTFAVLNTLSCIVTATTGEALDQQTLDLYAAYLQFDPEKLSSASYLESDPILSSGGVYNTQFRGTNVSCGLTGSNANSGGANVLVASELSAARSITSLAGLSAGSYGIVRADPEAQPCKVVPHDNPPPSGGLTVVGIQDSEFGQILNSSVVFAFAYTFNAQNTLQYNNMADQINALQSAYTFSSVLTTCIATIVAGAGVPIFSKIGAVGSIVAERSIFLALIIAEIAGSISAAVLRILDMSNFNQGGSVYQVSDTGEGVYNESYYNQNLLINVMATMEARISTFIVKIALLVLSILIATAIILYRWRQKLKGSSYPNPQGKGISPSIYEPQI